MTPRGRCAGGRGNRSNPQCAQIPHTPTPGMSVRHHHTPTDRTPNPVNIAPPTKAVGVYVPAIPVPISRLSSCMHGAHAPRRSHIVPRIHIQTWSLTPAFCSFAPIQREELGWTCSLNTRGARGPFWHVAPSALRRKVIERPGHVRVVLLIEHVAYVFAEHVTERA